MRHWKSSDWLVVVVVVFIFVLFWVLRASWPSNMEQAVVADSSPAVQPAETKWGYGCVDGTIYNPQTEFCESPAAQTNPAASFALTCAAGFKLIGNFCFKICQKGYHAPVAGVDRCVKLAKGVDYIVDRGFFGGCPTGYVDHPADPDRCVLPIVAARMTRHVR